MRINVGDMAITNLEKIEEAYLYIIELKKNDTLKTELKSLHNHIEDIKNALKSSN